MKAALEASALSPITHCDISGENDSCGAKLNAIIVSTKFDGMPLLQRQKAVHEAVRSPNKPHTFITRFFTLGQLKVPLQRVHAFSMKTWTPAQFAEKTAGSGT